MCLFPDSFFSLLEEKGVDLIKMKQLKISMTSLTVTLFICLLFNPSLAPHSFESKYICDNMVDGTGLTVNMLFILYVLFWEYGVRN